MYEYVIRFINLFSDFMLRNKFVWLSFFENKVYKLNNNLASSPCQFYNFKF